MPLALAALAMLFAACGDDPTRPDILAELLEAEAIDRSAAALPGMAELLNTASAAGLENRARMIQIRELWTRGTNSLDGHGADHRRGAAALAVPLLAAGVPEEDWRVVRSRLEDWLSTADRMLLHLELPTVRERLADARRQLDRADAATSNEERVYHTVLAVSELVETTPRYVARTLVADAKSAVARAESAAEAGLHLRLLTRARRLADRAGRAMDEEDHMRAIQRAYYAIQLVEDR